MLQRGGKQQKRKNWQENKEGGFSGVLRAGVILPSDGQQPKLQLQGGSDGSSQLCWLSCQNVFLMSLLLLFHSFTYKRCISDSLSFVLIRSLTDLTMFSDTPHTVQAYETKTKYIFDLFRWTSAIKKKVESTGKKTFPVVLTSSNPSTVPFSDEIMWDFMRMLRKGKFASPSPLWNHSTEASYTKLIHMHTF